MKYDVGTVIPFEQIDEATAYVNSIEDNYYLEDYQKDEQGRMMLIIRQMPIPSLEEIKERKISTLKEQRDALEVEDITVDGNTFDYDEKARERINNAIIALQASGASIHWTLADHQSVEVTAEDLIKVVSAVAIRSNALHVAYRKAKEEVLNAETEEEVNAVELEVTDA